MFWNKVTPEKIDSWTESKKIENIIEALNHEETLISEKATDALQKIGSEAVEKILELAKKGNHKMRIAAIKGIGKTAEVKGIDILIDALSEKDADIKVEAAVALGNIKSNKAVHALINVLDNDNYILAEEAAHALKKIGENCSDEITAVIRNTGASVQKRVLAIEILSSMASTKNIEVFIIALKDIHDEIKTAASNAFSKIGKPAESEVLKLLSNDELCALACHILADVGDMNAVDPLLKVLNGTNKEAIAQAIYALGTIGNNKVIDPLIEILSSDKYSDLKTDGTSKEDTDKIHKSNSVHREIKRNAIVALGQIGTEKATEQLIKSLKTPYLRDVAVVSLVKLGENAILKALEKDEWFADDASIVLSKMGSSNSKQLLNTLKEWKK